MHRSCMLCLLEYEELCGSAESPLVFGGGQLSDLCLLHGTESEQ